MRDGFKVIDADRHVLEPTDLFAKYLPEKFRHRVEIEGPNQSRRFVDGELISDADRLAIPPSRRILVLPLAAPNVGARPSPKRWRRNSMRASNVRDMDREGVDISVLFPTLGLYIMWRDNLDPELSAAICRAYNTWLSDYCSYDTKRLHGVA